MLLMLKVATLINPSLSLNFSICGLPFFLSGQTPDWRQLAHRTEFEGIEILLWCVPSD